MIEMAAGAKTKLVNRAITQIKARELRPEGYFSSFFNDIKENGIVLDRVKRPSMWLIRSTYFGQGIWATRNRTRQITFLCGNSEGRDWAVRIPSTITTVEAALSWITPTAVKRAREAGKKVLRQGDMYFVPIGGHRNNLWDLYRTRHQVIPIYSGFNINPYDGRENVAISHPQHKTVTLEGRYRAYGQKQLGSNSERVAAD